MAKNVTADVEVALAKLDSYDRVVRQTVKRVLDEYETYTYVDLISSSVGNRAMQLIYGFTTLVRSDNYSTAHHLIRIHLNNYLRYSALWLHGDPQALAIRIASGERLDKIEYAPKKRCTDKNLATEAAKSFPWIIAEYEKLSGYIHFSQAHVRNATEWIDEKQHTLGFHANRYDMVWGEDDRLEGIALMEKITNRLVELMVQWCETKERSKVNGQEMQHPVEYLVATAPQHIVFEYRINGEKHTAKVLPFDSGEGMRYRIRLNPSEALIIKPVEDTTGETQWEQEPRQGADVYEAALAQAVGEGLEKANIWRKNGL